MDRTAVASTLFSGLLLCGLAQGCSSADSQTESQIQSEMEDRYAHRVIPRSKGWRMESKIPLERAGVWEVSRFRPGTPPTDEHRRAADDLVERCFDAAQRYGWQDFEKALADGFEQPPDDPTHFRNLTYKLDDRILDPDRPEYLMYFPLDGEMHLTGFMFFGRTRMERGPQIAGNLAVWHYHLWNLAGCFVNEIISKGWASKEDGTCEEGAPAYRSGEMMHVWLIDRPKGRFMTSMIVPPEELREGVAKRLAERGF